MCVWRILTDSYRNIALGALYSPEWESDVCNSPENASTPLRVYDGGNASASELVMSVGNGGDFHTVYSSDRFVYIQYVSQNATILPFLAMLYTTFFKGKYIYSKVILFSHCAAHGKRTIYILGW